MKHEWGDLNKIIDLCDELNVGCTINYWKFSDEMQINIDSNADEESFYMKRIIDIEHFIKSFKRHIEDVRKDKKKFTDNLMKQRLQFLINNHEALKEFGYEIRKIK